MKKKLKMNDRRPDPTPEEIEQRKKEVLRQREKDKEAGVGRHTPDPLTGGVPWSVPGCSSKPLDNRVYRVEGD